MQDKPSDCYFYFENDMPSEDDCMKIMCVKCHDEKKFDKGWFWQGSQKGYGPFNFICNTCGTIIYSPQTREKNEKT